MLERLAVKFRPVGARGVRVSYVDRGKDVLPAERKKGAAYTRQFLGVLETILVLVDEDVDDFFKNVERKNRYFELVGFWVKLWEAFDHFESLLLTVTDCYYSLVIVGRK